MQENIPASSMKNMEEALLGFILLKPDPRMYTVRDILSSPDFFSTPINKKVYATYCRLCDMDEFPEDPTLMAEELFRAENSKFESIDAAARYVNSIIKDFTMFNPEEYLEYAKRLKWEYDRKRIKEIAESVLATAENVSFVDREEWLTKVESGLGNVTLSVRETQGLRPIKNTLSETIEMLDRLHNGETIQEGVKTGIRSLDRKIGGLNGGEVIVLAAPTGSGKTAASMAIATNIAMQENKSVLIFSLEMMDKQVSDRMVGRLARISMDRFKKDASLMNSPQFKTYSQSFQDNLKDRLTRQYWRAKTALEFIPNLPIYTTTDGQMTPNAIRAMIQQKKREIEAAHGPEIGLVVIDYLQIMQPPDTNAGSNRTDIVGAMSRKVKQIAKEFNVPIMLLSQLSRASEPGESPQLRHLRESGSIEQDADKVLFIWSPHSGTSASDYKEFHDPYAQNLMWTKERMKMRITVAKNRQGESGEVPVLFDWECQDFVSQNPQDAKPGETFDDFCNKYYRKTRSGDDLFWPLRAEEMLPGMEKYRTSPVPEIDYLNDRNEIVKSSQSSQNRMSVSSTMPNTDNKDWKQEQQQKNKEAFSMPETPVTTFDPIKDEITPENKPQAPEEPIDDLSVDFNEDIELDMDALGTLDDIMSDLNS